MQRRAGTARHDAVAWGLRPRAPTPAGIDIIQNCGGHRHQHRKRRTGDRCRDDRAGPIRAQARSAPVVAGHSLGGRGRWRRLRLPVESHPLQAHGVGADQAGYATPSSCPNTDACLCQPVRQGRAGAGRRHRSPTSPMPSAAVVRRHRTPDGERSLKLISTRSSARLQDHAHLGRHRRRRARTPRPIIGENPGRRACYINCGWGTGGFKATPGSGWVFAHTIARDDPHPVNAPFSLERFVTGALIDEHGAAAVAH